MSRLAGSSGPSRKAAAPRTTVLVVDDEESFHQTITPYLEGMRRLSAYNGWQALQLLARHHVDVVLLDLNLPDISGLDLVADIRDVGDDLEVIVITSHAEIRFAVQAVKAGAFDFLPKAWENYQQLSRHIERALENRRRRHASELAHTDEGLRETFAGLEKARTPELAAVIRILQQAAPASHPVLLEGESGVGKALLARYLHSRSERRDAPFVVAGLAGGHELNVESALYGHEKGAFEGAARRRLGKVELAEGGTLYLDEVTELDARAQERLLCVLRTGTIERVGGAEPVPVDVRVVAATTRDLEREVAAGRLSAELFQRLNLARLRVPPLRERRVDFPVMARTLARRAARATGRRPPELTAAAIEVLEAYTWPGNLSELEGLVQRLVVSHAGCEVRVADLPVEYCVDHLGSHAMYEAMKHAESTSLYGLATRHFERYFVKYMVDRCGGNMAEAARRLGVSYTTVKNKIYDPGADE